MQVYKVVHKRKGRMVSGYTSLHRVTRLYYVKNKETVPEIGKIFAFSNEISADNFARHIADHPAEIWKADATEVKKLDLKNFTSNLPLLAVPGFLEVFWGEDFVKMVELLRPQLGEKDYSDFVSTILSGSVLCSSLTLRRKVTEYKRWCAGGNY